MEYTCPVCGDKVARDLVVFIGHTEKHIADEIRKKPPEWAAGDPICGKCIKYYRDQMEGR